MRNRNLLALFLSTVLALSFMLLCSCSAFVPSGASVPSVQQSSYPVPLQVTEFRVDGAAKPQTVNGVTAAAELHGSLPTLYYHYDVSSRINGKYMMMPSPPRIYTISKIPFFKGGTDTADVKLSLDNESSAVVSTGKAICVFELNDRTLVSAPLATDSVVPNQAIAVVIKGPTLAALEKTASHGVLTIWLYGINGAFDKANAFHWSFPYTLVTKTVNVTGQILGQTTTESIAKSYEGKVEIAPQNEQLAPPSSP